MDYLRTRNKNNIILYTNPFEDYNLLKNEINKSITSTLDSGKLILLGECDEKNYNYAVFNGDKLEIKNF